MQNNMDWEMIRRYLDGSISDDELRAFAEWLDQDPEHQEFINRMRSIWQVNNPSVKNWDVEKAYEATWQKIRNQEQEISAQIHHPQSGAKPLPITKPQKDSWGGLFMKIAAVLMVGLVTAFILYYTGTFPRNAGKSEIAYRTITSSAGQRVKLALADGTNIVLAPKSEVKIPSNYNKNERQIQLKGEAYFIVTHSDTHPFQVSINNTIVRDLGTKFDLRSYPSDGRVKVIVSHGKVSIQAPEVAQSSPLVITPGFMGEINFSKKSAEVTPVDTAHYMGWIKGDLSFKDEPFPEIALSLQRWYGLRAVQYNPSIAKERITTRFSSRQPVDDVVQALALSLNLDYKIRKDTLYFYNKRKP